VPGVENSPLYFCQSTRLNVLRYLRIPHAVPLTMGEASDLITQAKMREAVLHAAARGSMRREQVQNN